MNGKHSPEQVEEAQNTARSFVQFFCVLKIILRPKDLFNCIIYLPFNFIFLSQKQVSDVVSRASIVAAPGLVEGASSRDEVVATESQVDSARTGTAEAKSEAKESARSAESKPESALSSSKNETSQAS